MSLNSLDLLLKCERLKEATRFEEIVEISRAVFFYNFKEGINAVALEVLPVIKEELCRHFNGTKDIGYHKNIGKAISKIYKFLGGRSFEEVMAVRYEGIFGVYGYSCISIYCAMPNYGQPSRRDMDLVSACRDLFIQGSLRYSKETKFFPVAIENYTQCYDYKLVPANDPFVLTVICTNLENSHKNVHKLLLELFQRYVQNANEFDETEIMNLLLMEMSWYNRNKHYLLIPIVTTRPEMLLNFKSFDVAVFMNGLRCGLSQYHLYSSALSLVKVIYANSPFREELIKTSTDIILNGSDYEMKNFFKLWFTCFDDKLKDQLFISITGKYDFTKISSTSPFFYRSLMIRNAFNRPLSIEIENVAKTLCYSIDDVNIKTELFNLLLSEIYSTKDLQPILERIMRLLKFLHYNMCVEDSQFLDDVMRKLPNFFNYLATNRFRNKVICKEIFTIIRDDLFLHGIEYGSYESKVFSVRILQIMLKQYVGTSKEKRLSKKTDGKTNQQFAKYLADNDIWDITSGEIYNHLIKMSVDTENSDIGGIANEIIIEYYIKRSIIEEKMPSKEQSFESWIGEKMKENLSVTDVESYHENISFCKMQIEHVTAKESGYSSQRLEEVLSELKIRCEEDDPIKAMETGKSIFPVIDTINYALTRMDKNALSSDLIIDIANTAKNTAALKFLSYVNDGKTAPSFDSLDKNLNQLIENSSYGSESADIKTKLLLSIFFTTRALSELSAILAKIINSTLQPHENAYFIGMLSCIELNFEILARFCHKGAIESASQGLGNITKIISNEFLQQVDRSSKGAKNLQQLLIILKGEIDCVRRHLSKTGEIRGSRGLILMAHSIIKNHPPFLKFLMEKYLVIIELKSFYDTLEIKFSPDMQPIHLHLLAVIVKDSELAEETLPYYDYILLSTFRAYKETKDFVMQNALLQIIGNITTKISNHKRHSIEDNSHSYEYKSIAVYEHYVKFTYSYRVAILDLENSLELPKTYIIILLEILSNFEFREPYEYWSELDRPVNSFERLIGHPCEKIRVLAAKCFAQWQRIERMDAAIQSMIERFFVDDSNRVHGSIVAARHMIQRYELSAKFVRPFKMDNFLEKCRTTVMKSFKESQMKAPGNFYLRYHLLELLLFLNFKMGDEIVQELLNEQTVTSNVGYQLWRETILGYTSKK